jgi:peptide methionine sulfoxide reductase MsrB
VNKIIDQKQKGFFKVLSGCGELLFQSEKKVVIVQI